LQVRHASRSFLQLRHLVISLGGSRTSGPG
jgi:hypothetical protein